MTVQRIDPPRHFSFGISLNLNDGFVRLSRQGLCYDPPQIRVGFGPWLWRFTL